ncbi:MAG: phytoene/squalene synthase family protein [Xenococcaceae cyanobacterium MO_207.B15]|nr:phytoene/squalene synthase family protein [Xenococcaceae cyanobacterium MO_207.B15]MDJ0745645.1 phytoene/squalene synthase family protein [Xenococcaceae cyanobacterium MO_167.B27]
MDFHSNALEILKQTSRTFYIPISLLPKELQDTVASAYLCMRAIDEIEDHDLLDNQTKIELLQKISFNLQSQEYQGNADNFADSLQPYSDILPEVTLRIGEWANLPSETISPRIWDATAAMADRMAYWAKVNWNIQTLADLDAYTFSVAGAVGLLLSDIWAWYDGTETNRSYGIGFGRGLQAVNIIRNRDEDLSRGADFFPDGWQSKDMQEYARSQLQLGKLYTDALPNSPALDFCRIPLALAFATLDAIALGKAKLSRSEVLSLVSNF